VIELIVLIECVIFGVVALLDLAPILQGGQRLFKGMAEAKITTGPEFEAEVRKTVLKKENVRLQNELSIAYPTTLSPTQISNMRREDLVELVVKCRVFLKQTTKCQESLEGKLFLKFPPAVQSPARVTAQVSLTPATTVVVTTPPAATVVPTTTLPVTAPVTTVAPATVVTAVTSLMTATTTAAPVAVTTAADLMTLMTMMMQQSQKEKEEREKKEQKEKEERDRKEQKEKEERDRKEQREREDKLKENEERDRKEQREREEREREKI